MSRWSNWSRGSNPARMLSDFLKEGPVDEIRTGNPTGAGGLDPADRARQLGLQSNGKGGYIDPKTGQVVARTVNNELIFYSSAPGGGAVSDGSGGQALANPSTAWQDPISGLMTTPPGQPESPGEIAAVPDPVPAQAPAGYNNFIMQKKQELYQQDFEARQQPQAPPMAEPENNISQPEMSPQMDPAMAQPTGVPGMPMGENFLPNDLLKRTGGLGAPTFSDLRDRYKRSLENRVTNNTPDDIQPGASNPPPVQQQAQQPAPQPEVAPQPQPEVAPQVAAEPEQPAEPTLSEFMRNVDQVRGDYHKNLAQAIGVLHEDAAVAGRHTQRLDRVFDRFINDTSIPEEQREKLAALATQILGSFKGRRRDILNNDYSEEMIKGLLGRLPRLREAFAPGENGQPNPDNIRKLKEESIVHNYSEETLKKLFDALPPAVKENFKGGDVTRPFEGFVDYMRTDGKDLFTGLHLDPETLNQDHLIAKGNARLAGVSPELAEFIGGGMNHLPIHKAINQQMLKKAKTDFFDDMERQYGNADNRIDGLQDFIYGLNDTKYDVRAMPQQQLRSILTDRLDPNDEQSPRVFKDGLGEEAIPAALEAISQRYGSMLDPLEQRLKGFDEGGRLLGPSSARGMTDTQKAKRAQLKRGLELIQKMRDGADINDIFGALGSGNGLSRSVALDAIRSSNLQSATGARAYDALKRDFISQLREAETPQERAELQQKWEDTISSSNSAARSNWLEAHGGRPNSALTNGLSGEEALAYERQLRDQAEEGHARNWKDAGFIRDTLPPELYEHLMALADRQTQLREDFEIGEGEFDEEESFNEDIDGYSFWEILKILADLKGEPEEAPKPGLSLESFLGLKSKS